MPDKPPPLQPGDHLTREEFERRYNAMPHLKKAELIEGVVYMSSAVYRAHGWAHGQIIGWLAAYCAATPYVQLYDNTSVRLDMDNEVQPDALLRIETTPPQAFLSREKDAFLEEAPALIVEVASSSASYDLHEKLHVYRRNKVQEYVIWQLYENQLDWFQLQAGQYVPLLPDKHGVIQSQVFPGLCLAVDDLLAGNLSDVLQCVQQHLNTGVHAAFIQQLQSSAG